MRDKLPLFLIILICILTPLYYLRNHREVIVISEIDVNINNKSLKQTEKTKEDFLFKVQAHLDSWEKEEELIISTNGNNLNNFLLGGAGTFVINLTSDTLYAYKLEYIKGDMSDALSETLKAITQPNEKAPPLDKQRLQPIPPNQSKKICKKKTTYVTGPISSPPSYIEAIFDVDVYQLLLTTK